MLTGKPDAGNLHVRFDEGEWQEGQHLWPPVALYSTARLIRLPVLLSFLRRATEIAENSWRLLCSFFSTSNYEVQLYRLFINTRMG